MSTPVYKLINLSQKKLACITLDFEMDYDDYVGEFNIFSNHKSEIDALAGLFAELELPVTSFIRTDLLLRFPDCLATVKALSQDFHCHSHTHATRKFNSEEEILNTATTFKNIFGYASLGYRAPEGVLYPGDIELLKKNNFKFSSSVFPFYRPQKYNNFLVPSHPFIYKNGILEFPFASVPIIRYIISLSYIKLIGFPSNQALYSLFGLPDILVFDSHLHDYIVNEKSYQKLPKTLKLALGINKYKGIQYFRNFVELLRRHNYRFITMTELYHLSTA